jgi:hypothetical protein
MDNLATMQIETTQRMYTYYQDTARYRYEHIVILRIATVADGE